MSSPGAARALSSRHVDALDGLRATAVTLVMILVLAASTVVAALSWHLFERRFLALKDRWAPSRRTTEAGPSARAA